MSGSLQRRMVVSMLVVLAPIVAGLTVVLYLAVERAMWDTFDRELDGLAATYGGLVEYDDEDGYEFEPAEAPNAIMPGTHLQIWLPDGTVLARLPHDEAYDLPTGEGTEPYGAVLEGGGRARFVTRRAQVYGGQAPGELPTVVVGRTTEDSHAMLATLLAWFIGLGVTTLVVASIAAWQAVIRGLAPVSEIAARIDGIDATVLRTRIPEDGVPSELSPVARRLNELLDRVQSAFQRERRFTADVAHELRTPLSILQTSLELALRTDRPAAEYRQTLADALDTAQQTGILVENLLMLARLDSSRVQVTDEDVELRALITSCWAPLETAAAERGLELRNEVDAAQTLVVDRGKLRLIAANLLGNAAEYTERGGWIRVRSAPAAGVVLDVSDSGPPIPAEQREQLFQRFWRGDEARSDAGVHCGIGLSLVRSLCDCLGYTIEVEGTDESPVSFIVRGPSQRRRAPTDDRVMDVAV